MDYFSRGVGGVATPPLVMHFCDPKTLLALARCNRVLRAAASCKFAWSQSGPLTVHSNHFYAQPYVPQTLVRFSAAGISVEWDRTDFIRTTLTILCTLAAIPNIDRLDLCKNVSYWPNIATILRQPCMQSIRQLSTPIALWSTDTIHFPPQIHTLTLLFIPNNKDDGFKASFPILPSLTSLRVNIWLPPSDVRTIGELYPHLRTLRVRMRTHGDPALVVNLASAFPEVRDLTIDSGYASNLPDKQMLERCGVFPRLETCRMCPILNADEFLDVIVRDWWANRELQSLVLCLRVHATLPTMERMQVILNVTAPLHITLVLPTVYYDNGNGWLEHAGDDENIGNLRANSESAGIRDALRVTCCALTEAFPTRMTVR